MDASTISFASVMDASLHLSSVPVRCKFLIFAEFNSFYPSLQVSPQMPVALIFADI